MIYGLYLSAQGAQIQSTRQDVIANNLANAATNSFKRDFVRVQSHQPYDVTHGGSTSLPNDLQKLTGGTTPTDVATDFSQGMMTSTRSPLDVAINGKGFVLLDSLEPSLPFRTHRATYGYTPTFVERTNVSGNYSDETQDFFLTASQNDWSGGAMQQYLRPSDQLKARKYWMSSGMDVVSSPGNARPGRSIRSVTLSANPQGASSYLNVTDVAVACTSNLNTVDAAGAVTDKGAHGAGNANKWGICSDYDFVYIAGATKIRKWNGSVFSDFSATANAGSLATLNNALYSCDGATLNTYDGTGVKTPLFTWKDNTNTAYAAFSQNTKIVRWGSKLLIFFAQRPDRPSLWLYDGTGTSMIADFPPGVGYDIQVIQGIVYVSGTVVGTDSAGNLGAIPVIWSYLNGTVGEIWRSPTRSLTAIDSAATSAPALSSVAGQLLFTSYAEASVMGYDPASGAIYGVGPYTVSGLPEVFGNSASTAVLGNAGGTAGYQWPGPAANSTALLCTSLIDFDNSLTKTLRGVKVVWTGGSGQVNIFYSLNSLPADLSAAQPTTLQANAVSGTEYLFPAGTTATSVSVWLGTNGAATIKRIYVRAAPILQAYRTREYILDLSGDASRSSRTLRDGTPNPLTGRQQADNLITAATATAPFTIIDRFSSFTGIIEPSGFELYEIHPSADNNASSGTFVAKVTVREV